MEEESEDIVEDYYGEDDQDELGFSTLLNNAQVVVAMLEYFNETRNARRKRKLDAAAACILDSKKTKIEVPDAPPGTAVLHDIQPSGMPPIDPEMPALEGASESETLQSEDAATSGE